MTPSLPAGRVDGPASPACGNVLRPGRTSFSPSWQCVAPVTHVVLPLVATRCTMDARRSPPCGNALRAGRTSFSPSCQRVAPRMYVVLPLVATRRTMDAMSRTFVATRRPMDGGASPPRGSASSHGRTCVAPSWQRVERWTAVRRSLVATCRAMDGHASPPSGNVSSRGRTCVVPASQRCHPQDRMCACSDLLKAEPCDRAG